MSFVCPRCSRRSPAEASFCYFDGHLLQGGRAGGPVDPGKQAFHVPLVLPGGVRCQNFDQLALNLQNNWATGVALLRRGELEQFLGGMGRGDLAQAAREAAHFPDVERGLDQFLGKLPSKVLAAPKLEVGQTEISLKGLRPGKDHPLSLRVSNAGGRLLYGAVASGVPWLSVGSPGHFQKLIQCQSETNIPLIVLGQQLRGSAASLKGKLVIETNGGTAIVRVRAEAPVQPFPGGVLAGATSPRGIAELAKKHPKEAAQLFEKGAVQRWYRDNGWAYPVQGPAASGLGAVQQFFEALGLTKPPQVELSEASVRLSGRPNETLFHSLHVFTREKRPVFAHARGIQQWLHADASQMQGTTTTLPLRITVPACPGETLQGQVLIQANGNQRFSVPVTLTVAAGMVPPPLRPAAPLLPVGAAAAMPAAAFAAAPPLPRAIPVGVPMPLANGIRQGPPPLATFASPQAAVAAQAAVEAQPGMWRHLIAALVLLLLLFGLLIRDSVSELARPVQVTVLDDDQGPGKKLDAPVFAVMVEAEPDQRLDAVDIQDEPPEFDERIKQGPKVIIEDEPATGPAPKKGDLTPIDPVPRIKYQYGPNMRYGMTALKDKAGNFLNKLITYSPVGGTNGTWIKVDGKEIQDQFFAGLLQVQAQPLPDDRETGAVQRTISTLVVKDLHISQILEIVPSKQPVAVGGVPKRLLDSVMVRYVIENKGTAPHKFALRVMIDTLIGNNDGVPFTVPGYPGLVTKEDFSTPAKVPSFVQALETGNLQYPGTVAHMTLKLGGLIEPPDRVLLTRWPSGGSWFVAALPISGDSCVILYWPDKVLQPGQRREVGFAYGLGGVDADEGQGKLGFTLDGAFEPGKDFTVTAYLNNPVPGQSATLTVPPGLQVQGQATQAVPAATGLPPTSVLTWTVKVNNGGKFRVEVKTSNGLSQAKLVTIAEPVGNGGAFALDLKGEFAPGKKFTVSADVNAPVPNQTLTLQLPAGLSLTQGTAVQMVPPAIGSSKVNWQVQVNQPGKFSVKVQSSTGLIQGKTFTASKPDDSAGQFELKLQGDIAPGKTFSLSALVTNAVPKQTLRLELPRGLVRVGGEDTAPVPPAASGTSTVQWQIKVADAGKYSLGVHSSTGLIRKKTLTIGQASDKGGFDIVLSGDIKPGATFTVTAKVTDPVTGQRLTLVLPKQLEAAGAPLAQPVPAGQKMVEVSWPVRVIEAGRLPIRIESTTGLVRTKTITLKQGDGAGTIFGK